MSNFLKTLLAWLANKEPELTSTTPVEVFCGSCVYHWGQTACKHNSGDLIVIRKKNPLGPMRTEHRSNCLEKNANNNCPYYVED